MQNNKTFKVFMKLLILSGFLGSGKTTLLLHIAKKLSLSSKRIAIIENEIGEIGIDGDYLNLEGLQVQELFGGCICCTLSVGLIETLENVEKLYQPDVVILEATGVARPGDILKNVRRYYKAVKDIYAINVVDATRYDMLMDIMTPLMTGQIGMANIVAVNKIDSVESEKVDKIVLDIGAINPQAKVVAVSAEDGINMNLLLDDLL